MGNIIRDTFQNIHIAYLDMVYNIDYAVNGTFSGLNREFLRQLNGTQLYRDLNNLDRSLDFDFSSIQQLFEATA